MRTRKWSISIPALAYLAIVGSGSIARASAAEEKAKAEAKPEAKAEAKPSKKDAPKSDAAKGDAAKGDAAKPKDVESKDILARAPRTEKAEVLHVLIAWKEL